MYPGAQFYGIGRTLLAYAGLPAFLPFPVALQHGWQRHAHAFEASANPPEIWVWSPRMAAEMEAFYPAKRIRVIGSFFCYLKPQMINLLPEVEKRGSICIPPHSSHSATTEYSSVDFARRLAELGDEYKPITVMLYYLDVNSATVEMYERLGFNVVTNGALFDEDFLKRFICNVYDKRYCVFSDLGTGVVFAADMGLCLVHFDIESRVVNHGNAYITDEYISRTKSFDEEFLRSLNSSLLSSELGESCLLSPSELRKLILSNYFTWLFARTAIRRVGGIILRGLGLRKRRAC